MIFMKKICLLLCILITAMVVSVPVFAENSTVDFVLTGEKYNIRGSELLAIADCVSQNNAHGGHANGDGIYAFSEDTMAEELNGQMLHRVYEGDSFTFTVDFGSIGYESMGFYYYGLSEKTVIELFIDNNSMGQGEILGGNGWADYDKSVWRYDEIVFDKAYTGIHEIKILAISSPAGFPPNAFGNFIFNQKVDELGIDFVLDKDGYNIKGSQLLAIKDCVNQNNEHGGHANGDGIYAFSADAMSDEMKGQMLHRVYEGDSFTFTVDFGNNGYESMGFYDYGLSEKTVIELFIDGNSVGQGEAKGGNGWADYDKNVWNYSEIEFDKVYTGVHEIKILVISSPAGFPPNAFGNFLFNAAEIQATATPEVTATPTSEATATPEATPTAPATETGDANGNNMIWFFIVAVSAASIVALSVIRRKNHA